jgi:SAM-dependent methyltransferase
MARQRVLWLYLQREAEVLRHPGLVLQFAPDWASYRQLSRTPHIAYVTGDIHRSPLIRRHIDIVDIPLGDRTVDVVLCSHVLEHVPDDRAALRELRRILRPSGVAFFQHPVVIGQATTDEDPSVTDPRDRQARWGQADHVRAYGADYESRLVDAGFDVQIIPYHERLALHEAELYGLQEYGSSRSQDIAVCRPEAPVDPPQAAAARPQAAVGLPQAAVGSAGPKAASSRPSDGGSPAQPGY